MDTQLLSSQTNGTFTFSSLQNLGTQTFVTPAGVYAVLTIDSEQILVSSITVLAGQATATISQRGWGSTAAATHAAAAVVQITANAGVFSDFQNELVVNNTGLITQTPVTTIVSATSHTIAGNQTAIFVVGRTYVFKVVSTWYRAIVTAVSYGAPTTTVTLIGDGLPAAGTVVSAGFTFTENIYAPVDLSILKNMTNVPSSNPPAGHYYVYCKGGFYYSRDESGNVRPLGTATAAVSSSSGTVILNGSVASFWETTLTENITTVTMASGVDGNKYIWRIKQHASSAKLVTSGVVWRYNDTIPSWTMSTGVSKTDYVGFCYNGAAAVWDVVGVVQNC